MNRRHIIVNPSWNFIDSIMLYDIFDFISLESRTSLLKSTPSISRKCSTILTFSPMLLSIDGLEASLPSHSILFMYQQRISKELMAFQDDRELRMIAK